MEGEGQGRKWEWGESLAFQGGSEKLQLALWELREKLPVEEPHCGEKWPGPGSLLCSVIT